MGESDMTRFIYIIGKAAEPGPTQGQSLPHGREEMFFFGGWGWGRDVLKPGSENGFCK